MNNIKVTGLLVQKVNQKEGFWYVNCARHSGTIDEVPVMGKRLNENEPITSAATDLDLTPFVNKRVNIEGIWSPVDQRIIPSKIEETSDEGFANEIVFEGTVKKIMPLRTTKKGRQIQDIYCEIPGFEKYIKVISWEAIPDDFPCLDKKVRVTGRMQSREYTKESPFGKRKFVSYEVSLAKMDLLEDEA